MQQQAGPHETSQILADDYIMLEPFARMNHSYKFYAETDVYEAIAAVRKHYNIDAERIVIRGHSMGGHQGSARLAIQNPTFFGAFEASAGYSETQGIRGQPPAERGPDAVSGSGAALRRRRRLRAERVQRAVRELRRRERRTVEGLDSVPRSGRARRLPADEGISLQVDDERSARAVSRRPRHRARVAQGEQGRIRSVPPEGARRNGRQSLRTTCGSSPTRRDTTTRTG